MRAFLHHLFNAALIDDFRIAQRDPILRALGPRQGGLNAGKIQFDDVRVVDRGSALNAPESLRFGVGLHQRNLFGGSAVGWLVDPWALEVLITMVLWGVGTGMVIFLAALQGIPTELREAAATETGATESAAATDADGGAGTNPAQEHLTGATS